MATFRFNFSGESNKEDQENKQEIKWFESEEVLPKAQIENLDDIAPHAVMFVCEDIEIGHVVAKDALLRMGDHGLKNAADRAEKEHSDLITGTYEGGLKIWECTYDLIKYLEDNESKLGFENKKVLDLGCGAGLLGIYTFMNGANVTFQDYNKEVLECVTIPNVLLNCDDEDIEFELTRCKFYSGDWASFNQKLPDTEFYDLILTCETIYNPSNYGKLIDLFLQRLTKDGTIYLAAKTHYFGVGGGTREFEKCIKNNSLLKSEVCWKNTSGVQREIIKITRNHDLFLID
ncbi:histidine protein methyltransferase 1 homolog isoform X2 [Pectinophora gossypiella]|uniref:histidine protein methyltransferase 1 homolog isoform X2 n=1 Tax=Pectinophora gossypiella TaxID=13191 RepID=UPI00214F5CEE|nr:histidine protein methyltransferase 1 homolog isoform X2 [Pectinophora gossypiella]